MDTFLILTAIVLKISALFIPAEGNALLISEEVTVYAGQNLRLSCQLTNSLDSVNWYKLDKSNKNKYSLHHFEGPSYTITMATVDDMGIYLCVYTKFLETSQIKKLVMVKVIVSPGIPENVRIEQITSFTARVGWTVSPASLEPQVYHVELTATSSKNIVMRTSSKSRSVTFTHLQPDTVYQVRVQAENRAGNGSSSSFVKFKTKASPPIIVSSPTNGTVSAGQPLKLTCTQARPSILWYKQGSDKPIAHGQELIIREASSSHEATYYCASENGSKGSIYVSVITPPVITSFKYAMSKHEIIFLCETSNKHPVEYAWLKDGKPLFCKTGTMKVPLRNNTITGLYECHVWNIAGRASKSLAVAPSGKTVDAHGCTNLSDYASVTVYITVIAVLSVILAIFCFVCGILKRKGKLNFGKKRSSRELATQSYMTEMTPAGFTASKGCPESVTENYEDVIPNPVTQLPGNGHYRSLRRDKSADRVVTDVKQTMKPDYLNISPSNRNDSAANCMHAPLNYSQGGADKTKRPYVNIDDSGSYDM